jgi:hypothetical protein
MDGQRPLALTVLGGIQFAACAAACVVLLGESTLDGELSVADVVLAVAVALVGALVVGSTWNGGRIGWVFEVALAVVTILLGAVWATSDDQAFYGYTIGAVGVLWLAIVVLPQARAWFSRPLE